MSDKRTRDGQLGSERNQEARDGGEGGRDGDDLNTDAGVFGGDSDGGPESPKHPDPVHRRLHQEGEAPLPFAHESHEELGVNGDQADGVDDASVSE